MKNLPVVSIVKQTEKAIQVKIERYGLYWFPKSQITYPEKGGLDIEIQVPEWLLRSKGLNLFANL